MLEFQVSPQFVMREEAEGKNRENFVKLQQNAVNATAIIIQQGKTITTEKGLGEWIGNAQIKTNLLCKQTLSDYDAGKITWQEALNRISDELEQFKKQVAGAKNWDELKKVVQNHYNMGLEKFMDMVNKFIDTIKSAGLPKSDLAKKSGEAIEREETRKIARNQRDKDLAQAPKTKTPGEEKAEQAQKQKPPEQTKDSAQHATVTEDGIKKQD